MKPKRIQLSRKNGWRMPPNTVKVTRPGVFGNPFTITYWINNGYPRDFAQRTAVESFRRCLCDGDTPIANDYAARMQCIKERIGELRGKNLACWCKPNEPCHADVLLEIANAEIAP